MNNADFGKPMKNVRKHTDIKLVTTDNRRNQLVSEPNYHAIKRFSEVAIEMRKTKVKMSKPINVGIFIKILQMMLKKDSIRQVMKLIDPCLQEKNEKVIGLMKDELGGRIMTKFIAPRPQTHPCLIHDDIKVKKSKRTKKCVIKGVLKFNETIESIKR